MDGAKFGTSYAGLKATAIWRSWSTALANRTDSGRVDLYASQLVAQGTSALVPPVTSAFGEQMVLGWSALARGDPRSFATPYAALRTTATWKKYVAADPKEARVIDSWVSRLTTTGNVPPAPTVGTAFARWIVMGWAALSGGGSPTSYFTPSGAWRPTGGGGSSTDTGIQLLQAIHQGAGDYTSAGYSFSAFPNATKLQSVYRIETEASFLGVAYSDPQSNYDSQSVVCAEQMNLNPSWKAVSPTSGLPLHSFFGDHTGLIPDAGNTNFQKAAADNVLEVCNAKGLRTVYIDNMHGYIKDLTFEGEVPSGYTDDADWRTRAAIPFIKYFVTRLRNNSPPIYVFMNAFDEFDVALGEGGIDQDNGNTTKRFWLQLYQAGVPTTGVGLFREFWEQRPDTLGPFQTGDDVWYHHWTGWQSLVAYAQSLGFDFHGLVYNDGAGMPKFGLASALLDLDLSKRGTVWAWGPGTGSANPFTDTDLTRDVGWPATTTHQITGSLHWRKFPNALVIVNPSTANDTQTILGTPRTVNAGTALFV